MDTSTSTLPSNSNSNSTNNQTTTTTTPTSLRSLSPNKNNPPLSKSPLSSSSSSYRFSTQVVSIDSPTPSHSDQHGSSSVPIYQSATFKGLGGQYDYSRSGNPTRSHLEHHIAKISKTRHAFAVTSGMGALDVIFRVLKPGDHIIAGNDLYGGSNRLLTYLHNNSGITTHHIDLTRPQETLLPLLTQNDPPLAIRLILIESPTNPLLQIADIPLISSMVKKYRSKEFSPFTDGQDRDVIVVVDNTMMTTYLQRPIELGADVVYDSATKYLSGHHDLMAGVVCCDREDLGKQFAFTINSIGNGLSPFDSFLLLRGVKTLSIRLDRQLDSSLRIARYLSELGFHVNYPGLENHPGKEVHERMNSAKGYGAVMSFETGDIGTSERVVGGTKIWGISVSFGCVNSLISMPCLMSHASIDPAVRAARRLPEDLIRLCVGIEDPDDLIEDLESALLEAGAVRIVRGRDGVERLERVSIGEEQGEELVEQEEENTAGKPIDGSLVVSAPGKVILFGEHAVVHGVTAIAGSVDLRCYCYIQPRQDRKLVLSLHDAGLEHVWDIDSLPWDLLSSNNATSIIDNNDNNSIGVTIEPGLNPPEGSKGLNEILLNELEKTVRNEDTQLKINGALAFIYLFMMISPKDRRLPKNFVVRSSLPMGAGLGSSAAFSVCISSAILYSTGLLAIPNSSSSSSDPTSSSIHAGRRTVPQTHAELVNSWAFIGEKIIHGNPSGVDNSVATYGGAIAFTKNLTQTTGAGGNKMEGLHGFKSIRFLLTDTKVPRDTKTLVAGVGQRKSSEPEKTNKILNEIQSIGDEARRCLTDLEMGREEQLKRIEGLIDRNHELLNELGVGHPSLEAVKAATASGEFGLHTKLTGAGGGGCAVTVVPDDFSDDLLSQLVQLLSDTLGCKSYITTVGGSGFGVLARSSSAHHESHPEGTIVEAEGGQENFDLPDLEAFRNKRAEELKDWAGEVVEIGQRARWSFV